MGTRSSARAALVVGAVLLAVGAASAPAVSAGGQSGRVTLRFSENEKSGTAPISGTFAATGGLTDRGTATGTHFPVFGKIHGQQTIVAIDLVQTGKGARGGFVIKCRDSHFTFDKTKTQIVRATGRCVITSPTGAYSHLQPVASSVLTPTHPRKGYTHTERVITVRTNGG